MAQKESESIQSNQLADVTKRMLELFDAWNQLIEGEITSGQFTQALSNLRGDYLAVINKPTGPSEDLLWKQYDQETNLYKHYLELILKFNTFFYAVTGAIVSFYFTKADVPLAKYALLLPILMGIVFGVLFTFAIVALQVTRRHVFDLRDKLNLEVAPEINILAALLASTALLQLVIAGALLWFFFPALLGYGVALTILIVFLLWLFFR